MALSAVEVAYTGYRKFGTEGVQTSNLFTLLPWCLPFRPIQLGGMGSAVSSPSRAGLRHVQDVWPNRTTNFRGQQFLTIKLSTN